MTNHKGDVPAMPFGEKQSLGLPYHGSPGFTQRQRAAIDLRVPDSDTPWIDDMIRKALRAEFAKAALPEILAREFGDRGTYGHVCPASASAATKDAAIVADRMLAELEKGR